MNPFNALRRKPDNYEVQAIPTAVVQHRAIETEVQAVLTQFADLREQRDRAVKERDELKAERDRIKAQYDHAVELGNKAARHIKEINEEFTNYKSRTTVYQLERDEAVVKSANAVAELNGVMKSLKAIIDGHDIPAAQPQVAPDAEAPALVEPPTHADMIARIR